MLPYTSNAKTLLSSNGGLGSHEVWIPHAKLCMSGTKSFVNDEGFVNDETLSHYARLDMVSPNPGWYRVYPRLCLTLSHSVSLCLTLSHSQSVCRGMLCLARP